MIEVTQILVEQGQNQNKNKTQDQPPPTTRETPQSTNKEPHSPPNEIPTKDTRENLFKEVVDDSKDQKQANILEITKKWPKKLWSMVEQAKQGSNTFSSAPMEEIYADPNKYEFDADSICGYIGSMESQESLDEDLKKMPQYLGEHEAKSKIKMLPSIRGKPELEKDTANLIALLST